jgi:hypothetical protein
MLQASKNCISNSGENVSAAPFDFTNYDALGGNINWQDEIFRSAVMTSNSLSCFKQQR